MAPLYQSQNHAIIACRQFNYENICVCDTLVKTKIERKLFMTKCIQIMTIDIGTITTIIDECTLMLQKLKLSIDILCESEETILNIIACLMSTKCSSYFCMFVNYMNIPFRRRVL